MTTPDLPDLSPLRRAVLLRDRCRAAATADGERLGIPLSGVQANVAFDAMVDHIRADERSRVPDEVPASNLAQTFHETYERLAPDFGYRTREASAKPWDDVPEQNRALMIATCAEIIQHLRDTLGAVPDA